MDSIIIKSEFKICEKTLKPKRVFSIEIDDEDLMNESVINGVNPTDLIVTKIKDYINNIN